MGAVCKINTNYSQGKKLKTLIQVSNCHLLVVSYLDSVLEHLNLNILDNISKNIDGYL